MPDKPAPKPAPPRGDAGASSDPHVHDLIARRDVHIRNGDTDAAEALDAELQALGY